MSDLFGKVGSYFKNYAVENFQEKTIQESANHADSINKPFPTDDIWEKTHDFCGYEEMLNDDQVSVALRLKKDLVLGSGFMIETQDEGQEEIQADLEKALTDDQMRPFEDQLDEVITAYEFGFSVSEKIFRKRDDGSLTLKELKTRHPDTWIIETDKQGNPTDYKQWDLTTEQLTLDPKTLIHYINNQRFQDPYGKSDLRAAYTAYITKREVTKYLALFLEGAAKPIPVGRYDQNAPPGTAGNLLNILKRFQAKTALAIPKEIEVEFLEAKFNGDAFIKAINLFNLFIGRSLLVPDLLGYAGSETSGGSFSLGQKQMEVFFKHIDRRRKTLEKIIDSHILRPLVLCNFGEVDHFPKFKFKPLSDEDAINKAKIWLEAVKGKTYEANDEEINHFRALVAFPEGEVNRPEPAQSPFGPGFGGGKAELPEGEGEKSQDEIEKELDEDAEKMQSFAFKNPPGDFHKKTDMKKIKRQLESNRDSLLDALDPVVALIFEDLGAQIQRKKILEKKDLEKAGELKLKKLGDVKSIMKRAFRDAHKDAMVLASSEIFKQNFQSTPLPSDEFLSVLEQEMFDFVGDWAFTVNKNARVQLQKAIKDGLPLSQVLGVLDDEGRRLSRIQLERFARTKFTEVMNRGRLEFFESSGVVSGYQYSAVLDDRTTAICSGLHGKKFKEGTQPIPPLHFNCRSVIIPITMFEEFKPTENVGKVDIDTFISENLGEGFSKQ